MKKDMKKVVNINRKSSTARIEQKLEGSDVLIYNNAFAVALKYDRNIEPAPFVTYKSKKVEDCKIAADNISLPIIKHNIATEITLKLKNKERILSYMYTTVAQILAKVYNEEEQYFDNFLDDTYFYTDFKQKLSIELGSELKEMTKKSDLLKKIENAKKVAFSELGLMIPSIKVKDNLDISSNKYLIKIGHNIVGEGVIYPDKKLIINPKDIDSLGVNGIDEIEPAFGLPALWIEKKDCDILKNFDITVVNPSAVISTHLNEVIKKNAADILTRQNIYQILENLKVSNSEKYVEDILDKVSIETIQQVLFNLLKEQVPINEIEKILETLSINAHNNTFDIDILTQRVRETIARSICLKNISDSGKLITISLSSEVEEIIASSEGDSLTIDSEFTKNLLDRLNHVLQSVLIKTGERPVILCSPSIRLKFRRIIKDIIPQLTVMSYSEIPSYIKPKNVGNVKVLTKKVKHQKKISNKNIISTFNLDLVNSTRNIKFLTEKIVKSKNLNFSMCIYGESGTGKSAYARYLAQKLGTRVITKSAADLLGKYVGDSEKHINDAFEEATNTKSMLIIDEIDSFLYSRNRAKTSWEFTMVNQMLTGMEKFEYPFICTTNYIDILDQASLRRFTFKMKFGFLKPEKIETAFNYVFNMKPNKEILNMQGLTVSDFVSIKRECDILGIKNINYIAKMLDEVVSLKDSDELRNNIGFVH